MTLVETSPFVRDIPTTQTSGDAPWIVLADGVEIRADAWTDDARAVLLPGVVGHLAALHRALEPERQALLAARVDRQRLWDGGAVPGYLAPSRATEGDWRVACLPTDLRTRRVEITGPVHHPRMVLHMLRRNDRGHRADTAMLDFEDAMKPTWSNVLAGVRNVVGVAEGTLTATKRGAGGAPDRFYALDPEDMPLPMIRVRGLHLDAKELRIDGVPVSAGLFDFAVCMVHTAERLLQHGRTPAYYVPKCEHHLEARWWNVLFRRAQRAIGLPIGTIRATFLIETLPAAFQMEEILFEIREHAAGLNVGRWDKIFSDIKCLKRHPDRVLADRATIGMERAWMRRYAQRLVNVCHRRGALALGGMAAFTPGKDAATRAEQTAKVAADKALEASLGHDGCWVSHPYFIGTALAAFRDDNQLGHVDDTLGDRPDLLPAGGGPRTLAGLRTNVRVGIAYLKGWLSDDLGCVAWDGLMEDLATLEISRAQTWQWLAHGVQLESDDDGGGTVAVTRELVRSVFDQELLRIHEELATTFEAEALEAQRAAFTAARNEAERVFTADRFEPFLVTRTATDNPPSAQTAERTSMGARSR